MLPTLAVVLLVFWLSATAVILAGLVRARRLCDVSLAAGSRPPPRLAVVMPALDEEAGIRPALESLLRQDYPDLVVVPVNDRSTDRTGAIMDEIAAAAPDRVFPVHVRELPPGWLGKSHANAVGAREARRRGAEWILFTDGDVQFAPTALRRAVAYAVERGLGHLAVAPDFVYHTFAEGVLLTSFFFHFGLRFRPWFVENPKSRSYVGVGAFNLVHVATYEAIGGHEPLALTVVDDVALGKLVRRAGHKPGFLVGEGEVSVAWQPSLRATVRGLYKNTFAALDFHVGKALVAAAITCLTQVWTFASPLLVEGPFRFAAVAALALQVIVYAASARAVLRRSRPYALAVGLCSPFGALLIAWIVLASTAITLRQGGVVWRGTRYPLALLRERQVRV